MAVKIKYRVLGGCVKCMTCIYQCPMQAITLIPDVSAQIDPEKCIGCGTCYDSCQPGAIVPYKPEEN
jgi:ferredoxin